MTEAAVAEVTIIPVSPGASNAIADAIDGTGAGTRAGEQAGRSLVSRLGSVVKGVGLVTLAGVGAAIGTALTRGFSRLQNIDQATASLRGLGHSGEAVQTIMDSALASVRGTAFGMGDAAQVAANAVAAGVPPGEALTRTLKLTADAASIAGISMGEMGSIFNKVAAADMVQMDVINQLHDAGVPALALLAQQMGVTNAEARQLASDGKINFATFQAAMEAGLGGAALESGNTFTGAMANVGASLGRIGAGLMGGLFPKIAPLLQAITAALAPVEAGAKGLGETIGTFLGPMLDRLTLWIAGLDVGAIGAWIAAFDLSSLVSGMGTAGPMFESMGQSVKLLMPLVKEFVAEVPNMGSAVGQLAAAGLPVLTNLLAFLAQHVQTIIAWMPLIIAAFIAWKVATSASTAATNGLLGAQLAMLPVSVANNVARTAAAAAELRLAAATGVSTASTNMNLLAHLRTGAALVATRIAMVAGAVATGVATAAQWALNAALSANPIGIVIALIVALVAGLIWFFTQTQLGQQIWANFTSFLSTAWTATVNWLVSAGATLAAWWNSMWAAISAWAMSVWNGIVSFVMGYAQAMANIIVSVIRTVQGVWNAVWSAISNFFRVLWAAIVATVTMYMNVIRTVITTAINAVRAVWTAVWGAVTSFFSAQWNIIRGIVSTVAGVFGSAFNAAANAVRTAFSNVVNFIRGIINGIIGTVNGAIAGINGVVGAVGGAFGINVRVPSIPRLAEGGLVSKATLAVVGEGRYQEAVVPLSPKFWDAIGGRDERDGAFEGPVVLEVRDADGVLLGTMQGVARRQGASAVSAAVRARRRGGRR